MRVSAGEIEANRRALAHAILVHPLAMCLPASARLAAAVIGACADSRTPTADSERRLLRILIAAIEDAELQMEVRMRDP
jgi:hypothetical protein